METMLLRDPEQIPTDKVIQEALGDSYPAFAELVQKAVSAPCGLNADWNYYKDGKAWLCKVSYRKKTVFWLSVWANFFKVAFYFTEKNSTGIENLDISHSLKEQFGKAKLIGRLIPLVIDLTREEQIQDVLTLIEYKKKLK